jgi:formyltetrahydrofolate deformylase
MSSLIALLHGPDQPGLVAKTSSWIFERGGNILHADQHRDDRGNIFFQRIEWQPAVGQIEADAEAFPTFAESLGMEISLRRTDLAPRVVVMVSKIPHCFLDLLARWEIGEFDAELAGVLSNHDTFEAEAARRGLPFLLQSVRRDSKPEDEAKQLAWLADLKPDLVVMARYMQVLSAEFLERVGCPVINIHHSFLPAFAGARPYHQAHERGVKLIGATAHYATAVLDDGPIIHQAVTPVSHRHSVDDLVRLGRDLEKTALAQAVRWHLQHRILAYDNKTVVFD